MSGKVMTRSPVAGVQLEVGPKALPSLRSDSISKKHVGNQIGPRQFELPPLILMAASAGS